MMLRATLEQAGYTGRRLVFFMLGMIAAAVHGIHALGGFAQQTGEHIWCVSRRVLQAYPGFHVLETPCREFVQDGLDSQTGEKGCILLLRAQYLKLRV